VIPTWHVTHPGPAQIERLIGAWPEERRRDVFATALLPVNRLFTARWVHQLQSTQGHVVVRVAPDGRSYRVWVTDSAHEDGPVTRVCGPYVCRA
jgi:hypothetical protein